MYRFNIFLIVFLLHFSESGIDIPLAAEASSLFRAENNTIPEHFVTTCAINIVSDVRVQWQSGTGPHGTTLDANGGGVRVFAEKETADGPVKNIVLLSFSVDGAVPLNRTIYYRCFGRKNSLLEADQRDNNWNPDPKLRMLLLPAGQTEATAPFVIEESFPGDKFFAIASFHAERVLNTPHANELSPRYQVQPDWEEIAPAQEKIPANCSVSAGFPMNSFGHARKNTKSAMKTCVPMRSRYIANFKVFCKRR